MPQPHGDFPAHLQRASQWMRLVDGSVPVVVMRPQDRGDAPLPFLLWFHGRTVSKELDAGRYLRLVRAGIACVAVDLPGHGERFDAAMQDGTQTLRVVELAAREIDAILSDLRALGTLDMTRIVIGGMSAGGMVAMVRCCTPHPFCGVLLEATTGDFEGQAGRPMYDAQLVRTMNPMTHLEGWREIPLFALHSELDAWVSIAGQRRFVDAVRAQSAHPEQIELHAYEQTGAPHEHMGFGKMAGDAKARGTAFIAACVGVQHPPR